MSLDPVHGARLVRVALELDDALRHLLLRQVRLVLPNLVGLVLPKLVTPVRCRLVVAVQRAPLGRYLLGGPLLDRRPRVAAIAACRVLAGEPRCLGAGLQYIFDLGAGDLVAQHPRFGRHLLRQRRIKLVLVDEEWRPHHLRRRRDLTALARWSSYPCHGLRPKRPSTTLPPGG